jgi:predicted transcriptional regulator
MCSKIQEMYMSNAVVATDKKRVSIYITEELKIDIERLANVRRRSMSNFIELSMEDTIKIAKENGEI